MVSNLISRWVMSLVARYSRAEPMCRTKVSLSSIGKPRSFMVIRWFIASNSDPPSCNFRVRLASYKSSSKVTKWAMPLCCSWEYSKISPYGCRGIHAWRWMCAKVYKLNNTHRCGRWCVAQFATTRGAKRTRTYCFGKVNSICIQQSEQEQMRLVVAMQ